MVKITSNFCDNYFPPSIIEVRNYNNNEVSNSTKYRVPHDGIYDKFVVGIFKVKYKKLNPNYYCDGQRNTGGC